MGKLLYLVHRLPYPPNKGDKVRSYHLLKQLAANHQVFLGTFVDDPDDLVHLPTVRNMCAEMHVVSLNPFSTKLRSLVGLFTGQALTMQYYSDSGMRRWVNQVLAKNRIDAVVVFSSAMGQYIDATNQLPLLVDFVDVDSAKWSQYAENHRWPLSWLYKREGQRLLSYERQLAMRSKRSFFVTENETALFNRLAPECSGVTQAMSNGVDADFFSPDAGRSSPFGASEFNPARVSLVFTGAMDYWPNIDAVTWFVGDILPAIRQNWPQICFYIVGRSPSPAVLALADDGVVVTGTVDDVRPYLQHATVVVAPLRVARGIQNKILEAMAMGRPVVASDACARAMDVQVGEEVIPATTAEDFANAIGALLKTPAKAAAVGQAGRNRVVSNYSWAAHLAGIERYLGAQAAEAAAI